MPSNISFWEYESYFENTDIVIIGAGIVGLSTAIALKKKASSLKIVVLEMGVMPSGASTKNAGFACFGSPTELMDDLSKNTSDNVIALVRKRWKGLNALRENIGDKELGYECNGGYELFTNEEEYQSCLEKLSYINELLQDLFEGDVVFQSADEKIKHFGFSKVQHLIYNKFEAQLNTGNMMQALYRKAVNAGVIVLYNSIVDKIEPSGSKVLIKLFEKFEVKCDKVLVATNGFAAKLLPEIAVQPARSQVLVTSPLKDCNIKGCFHYDKGYYYFRNVGNRLLLGGGRNFDFKNEFTDEFAITANIQNRLEELLYDMILPDKKTTIDYRWSGIMGVGAEKSPIIKRVRNGENIFCAVRMGGMGVAIGSLVALEAAEMLIES